ncbi:hypothetical protein VIBNIPon4_850024 [Vibrio nigripulchritudo POn4]|nr:hypothetical protein VIBNIFTn2_1130024 [Vibrio nigripulchritudo FTn2]CCN67704.1 hypothetical protein VIBNIPon4_850024 [Vibrio nigripulchritudo POn4]
MVTCPDTYQKASADTGLIYLTDLRAPLSREFATRLARSV